MKRTIATLSIALLSLGAAACEAPGAPDGPAGGNAPLDTQEGDEGTQTQLDVGDDDAGADG